MKLSSLFFSFFLLTSTAATAQVTYQAGPELDNDRDNKVNRMIGGDDNSFFCYRIRSKGRGTSFYVEKYDKKSLAMVFSQEISLEDGDDNTKIEDVLYAQNNVYIFRRQYDKGADKMTLFYQTVSSKGVVSPKLTPIVVVSADHYEFVDFDIYQTPDKSKFLVKSCHKPDKSSEYTSDFILLDVANGMTKKWTKTVNQRLSNNNNLQNVMSFFGLGGYVGKDMSFVGLYVDDAEDVYYCHLDNAKNSSEKEKRYRLHMNTLNVGETTPKTVDLTFDDDYIVKDIEFHKGDNNSMVVGGFVKDVIERPGRDLVKVGIFSFKVDLKTNTVASAVTNFFDEKMLKALESNNKKSRYLNYKLDYILPVGDAVYYVGEQYRETMRTSSSTYGAGGFGTYGGSNSTYWEYEYMDVIVAKLNSQGKFEWIKNAPLRNELRMNFAHVFKQYIAVTTSSALYILCNDHPKNMARYEKDDYEPGDLKSVTGIHGSNFVSNAVNLGSGAITRSVVFENDKYCFAPIQERNRQFMPPSECEIFTPGKNNEIYIYTEDRGKDQFGKITFK